MSDVIKYNAGIIEEARLNISTSSNKINGQLDELKRYLAPLVASWEGETAVAYNAAQAKWDAAAAEINDTLNKIGVAVGQGNEAMTATDKGQAGRFGG